MPLTKVRIQAFNNKRCAKSITIELKSWLTPNDTTYNNMQYHKAILKLSKRIKQNLYFRLLNTNVDINRTILITSVASQLIQPDKQSYINFDITIYNKFPYQHLKNLDNQKNIQTVINEVESSMKKERLFTFNHKQIKIPMEV